jgi:predicted porin
MGAVGKLDLALAYENHGDAFSGTVGKSMAATRLGASYDFGMVKLNALYANQDTVSAGAIKDRQVYGLGVAAPVGAGTVKAQYYVADQTSSGAKNGAAMWAVGYDHALSKSTTAYVAYAQTNNDVNGTFNVAGGGHGEYVSTITGKDPSAFSVGLQHKF